MITLKHISRTHQRGGSAVHALRDVSLVISPGEFVGITGPSGSGKSTLLNILGLNDAPSQGTVTFPSGPVDYSQEDKLVLLRRHSIGYIFQAFNLVASLTALENVVVSLMLNGASFDSACTAAGELLQRAGLGKRLDHLPADLSGGEMQRVAVCRAVIHKPKIILADEPTGNLDTELGDTILNLLREYTDASTIVVMATHSDRALGWCTRHIKLQDGRIVA